MTRRDFMRILPLTTAAAAAPAGNDGPVLRFGVVTDVQYADQPDSADKVRRYRLSPGKLREAIAALNRSPLDFVVNLGDTIDRNFASFEPIMRLFREVRAPLRHVLGNHDFDVAPELKPLVARRLGLEHGTYHAWSQRGWRFIVLDGTEVSLFAHAPGTPEHAAATRAMKALPGKPATWNGGISPGQVAWLKGQLAAARTHGERVILFCHWPVFPQDGHNLWNGPEVLRLVLEHRDVVAAWMNGHNHAGNYGVKDGVHFLNFKGMVDTAQNCWAEVTVFPDRLEVAGFAREPARSLPRTPSGG